VDRLAQVSPVESHLVSQVVEGDAIQAQQSRLRCGAGLDLSVPRSGRVGAFPAGRPVGATTLLGRPRSGLTFFETVASLQSQFHIQHALTW
jgi:hypothetical protein